MTYELLAALSLFAFVSSITPGPNNLMLLASGANFGWLRTVPHMAGVGFGFGLMVFLVGLGLSQVFLLFPAAYTILKAASVVFLVYLAYKIATSAPPQDSTAEPVGTPMTFMQAAVFQIVNPKAWAMAITANSAYAPDGGGLWSAVVVASVFVAINIPSINCWVFLGTQLRRLLNVPWKLRAFNITAAVMLLGSLYPILFSNA